MEVTNVIRTSTIPQEIPSYGCLESLGINKLTALRIASYLNDPGCKVREYFYTFYTLDAICDTTIEKVVQIVLLSLGIVAFTVLMPFTTPIGLLLRGAVATFESKPYAYIKGAEEGKRLPLDKKIKVAVHNGCFMVGGYSITDGYVTPPSDKVRMRADLDVIKSEDPDVVCLYEVPDVCDADYISSYLNYKFVIPVAGSRAIGPNSMMYVASNYEIDENSIEFTAFIKGEELTGRAESCEKGVLSFGLKNPGEEGTFATIFTTHLQHSEIPGHREEYEIRSREAQMNRIVGLMQKKIDQTNVIFVGDLNQPEEELNDFFEKHHIDWLHRDPAVVGATTWEGDEGCALLMGKEPSGPDVLDYAFIAGKAVKITTKILGTGYLAKEFRRGALSDHDFLFNTISLGYTNPRK